MVASALKVLGSRLSIVGLIGVDMGDMINKPSAQANRATVFALAQIMFYNALGAYMVWLR